MMSIWCMCVYALSLSLSLSLSLPVHKEALPCIHKTHLCVYILWNYMFALYDLSSQFNLTTSLEMLWIV